MLYISAPAIKTAKLVKRMEADGRGCALANGARDAILSAAQSAARTIGEAWARQIHDTNSFTGIRGIDRLAEYCACLDEYLMSYGLDCNVAHGGDAGRHVRIGSETTIFALGGTADSPELEIGRSSAYLMLLLLEVDPIFGLGRGPEIQSAFEEIASLCIQGRSAATDAGNS